MMKEINKEMNRPIISIIVPIYKVEKYLERCIESILSQTYTNLDILLVDDGSPDQCPKICDKYSNTDNRVSVIHKSNGGLSSARNAGIAKAKGKYLPAHLPDTRQLSRATPARSSA